MPISFQISNHMGQLKLCIQFTQGALRYVYELLEFPAASPGRTFCQVVRRLSEIPPWRCKYPSSKSLTASKLPTFYVVCHP